MKGDEGYSTRFTFGPLERRGVAGALRAGQLVLLGAGAAGAFVVLRLAPNAAGLLVALVIASAASLVAFVRVHGRSLAEWAPVAAQFRWRSSRGQCSYRSTRPTAGVIGPLDGTQTRTIRSLPDELVGCEVLGVPVASGEEVGVFSDESQQTLSATLAIRVRAFGLLSEADQERRLDRWGQALASLARGGGIVRRIQILERTVPADGDAMQRYMADARDRAMASDTLPRRSYEELLGHAGFVTQDHELFLTVQVDARRAASRAARASRDRHVDARAAAASALIREIQTFAARFDPADVAVDGVLPPRMLARAIRLAYDPYGRERGNRLAVADPATAGVDPDAFGPVATADAWERFRTDSAVHRTYWIAQWPRLAVAPTFLSPLLLSGDVVRSLAVVLEPVSPERSRRAVEAAITSDMADEEIRSQRGFRTSARQRRRHEAVLRREQELASGHQEFRFAGFVTVTGRDDADLEAACDQVEQSAHQAYLDLQPLWGEQRLGFVFGALPVARGLRPAGPLVGGDR